MTPSGALPVRAPRKRRPVRGLVAACVLGLLSTPEVRADATAALQQVRAACESDTLLIKDRLAALHKDGWLMVTGAERDVAAEVIGDSLSIPRYQLLGAPQISEAFRTRTRVNVAAALGRAPEPQAANFVLVARAETGDTYVAVRGTADRRGAVSCAAATLDATAGVNLWTEVTGTAPVFAPLTRVLRIQTSERRTPLFHGALMHQTALTLFDSAALETVLTPPFQAATGLFITSRPAKLR